VSRLERRRKKKEGAEKEEEKPHRFEQVPPLFSQPFFLVPPSLAQKKKSDRFCTRTKAEACEAGFGRVWALSAGCRLSGVKRRKFSTLGTRQHHYLWALLSNSYEEKELFRFTLHGVLNDSKAALAFEKEEDARAWHAALERALEGLHAATGRAAPPDLAASETPKVSRPRADGAAAAAAAAAARGGGAGGPVGWRGHLRGRSLGRELDFAAAGGGGGTRGSSPAGSTIGGGGDRGGGGWFGRSNGNARDASTSTSNRGGGGGGGSSDANNNNNSNNSNGSRRDSRNASDGKNAPANGDDLFVPAPRQDSSHQLERELQQTLAAPRRPRAAPPGVSMPGSPSEAAASNAASSHAFGGGGGCGGSSSRSSNDEGYAPGGNGAAENNGTSGAGTTTSGMRGSGDPVGLRAWYTEDGVTVYVGQDADGDDVLVESFVVRAPPRLCALTLLRGEVEGSGGVGFGPDAPQLLGSVDPHTQFLRARWSPPNGIRKLLAGPRELVLKRTWRRDDDGQYVILYTSADDDEVRSSVSSSSAAAAAAASAAAASSSSLPYSIFPPVAGRVLSSGYTFAPLLPEYDPARACAETLVTHVAKLDPGGFISVLRRHGGLPGRALARLSWGSLLLPLAQRSIALKNRAEAERFIARPFLAGSRSATTAAAVANNGASASASSSLTNIASGGAPSSSTAGAAASATAAADSATALGASSPATSRLSARDAAAAERVTVATHTRSIFRRAASPAVAEVRGANTAGASASSAAAAAAAGRAAPSVRKVTTTAEEDTDSDDDDQFDDVSEITDDDDDSDAEEALAAAGTMPREMWSCPGAAGFKVRGPTYLEDHRKVAAGEPMLSLAAVDLLHLDAPCFDVARHLASVRRSPAPFMFVVNLMIPGATPHSVLISWAADRAAPSVAGGGGNGGGNGGGGGGAGRGSSSRRSGSLSASSSAPNLSHLGTLARQETAPPIVAKGAGGVPSSTTMAMTSDASCDSSAASFYHEAAQGGDRHSNSSDDHDDDYDAPSSPFDLALARFLAGGFGGGDDAGSSEANARRDGTFKLIPRITEGSWIVKQSVGTTPCLLGHKLAQRYSRGPNYVEVDVDVASSSVAATVVGLVMGATKSVVVDMGIVLQGHAADELPEALLGTVRLSRVDMATGRWLDTRTGKLYPEGERPEWAK